MSDNIAFKYTGKGQASYGVPARDLTQAEYDDLSPDLKREVLKGGKYQKVGGKQASAKAAGSKTAQAESKSSGGQQATSGGEKAAKDGE